MANDRVTALDEAKSNPKFTPDNLDEFRGPIIVPVIPAGPRHPSGGSATLPKDHDFYSDIRGVGTTFALGLGEAGRGGVPSVRPTHFLMGIGVGVGDMVIDHTLFNGQQRKAPSFIADGLSLAVAFTPQPVYLKGIEMVGLHTAGRLIDKLVD
jgi:hypothetical protein